jgi:serine/threonine protein kinase
MHRDIKLDNIVLNASTGIVALLDHGCMMRVDGSNYCRGGSVENIPPEYTALTDGVPATYLEDELRKALSTPAVDVLLLARCGIEMIFGLPAELKSERYKKDPRSFIAYLTAVRTYDWSRHLTFLCANGMSDLADLLAACLAVDPAARPSAAQVLRMPFLQAVADEVDAAVAAATPGYIAECKAAVEMLAELQGEPCTFVTDKYHAYSNSSSETCSSKTSSSDSLSDNSSSGDDSSDECCSSRCSESSSTVSVTPSVRTTDGCSRVSCSTATDCCSGEQAAAVLAAASVLQAVVCSNSSSISGCSGEEQSSGESDAVQQQQQQSTAEQPVPLAAFVCEVGQQDEEKSSMLQRAAKFLTCMAWEMTF